MIDLEVIFISGLFLLDLSYFLKFVKAYVESLALHRLVGNLLLSKSSMVWRLIANKSIESLTFFVGEDLNAIDASKISKVFCEIMLSSGRRKVLNVEVASLLGVLES